MGPGHQRIPFDDNRKPFLTALSYVDGQTSVPLYADPSTGHLLVTSSGGAAGTQYAELSTTAPGTGNLSLGRYKSAAPSLTDGQMYGLQLDSSGNLKVTGSLSVGGTTDNASFTAGSSTGTPSMGFYHSTIDTVTDGSVAAIGITSKRAIFANLQTSSGVETGVASTPLQVSLANTAANATAVKVDGSAVTQPVSGTVTSNQGGTWNITNVSGTVSLPTGAATSAKQPTLGTAGTASSDVITVQGIASMTALKVDGSAVTQPVSGTVTSNIGTTNGLALDTSVNGLQVSQGSTTSGQKGNLAQGAVTTSAPTYTTAQTSPISLDTSGNLRTSVNNTVTISGTVTANAGTNLNTSSLALESGGNLSVIAGSVVSQETTTSGIKGITSFGAVTTSKPTYTTGKSDALSLDVNGLLRISLADTPVNANKILVTPDSVALPANQSVNISQINGVTPLMGNGTTGTGSQRVTIASDNSAVAGVGAGATGSGVPANAVYKGGQAKTSLPTAASDGNLTGVMVDKFGRQVVLPTTIRDLIGTQTTTLSASTSETTIVTAAASTFNDLLMIVVSNTSASTTTRIDFRDTTGGSVLFSLFSPGGDTRGFNIGGVAIPQTSVNTNWTAQCATSTTDVRIYAVFAKNK